jgi:glucoamylase
MAQLLSSNPAPNDPGVASTWGRADKDGVGTARSLSSQVWYTVAGGIVTEVYYPDVDTPQIRDLQLMFTDGKTFFHDSQRDFTYTCELADTAYPAPVDPANPVPAIRITYTAKTQPYSFVQEVISEPQSSCLLVRITLLGDPALVAKLQAYVLLAPHVKGQGMANFGAVARTQHGDRLIAWRDDNYLALGADCGFSMTSCGFVGVNDGWTDIVGNQRLPIWNYDSANNGNIALTAQINRAGSSQFVLALAICTDNRTSPAGFTPNPALVAVSEALSYPFSDPAAPYAHFETFVAEWKSAVTSPFIPKPGTTGDGNRLFNLSRNVLLAHEDKSSSGALVASLSIPWGPSQGDQDGGYHLVWPRDMCQSASALLAAGEIDLPLRGLIYLAASQAPDGSFFQNFYIDGNPHWTGQQLDEFSFPIVLAYRLAQAGALQQFDPQPMVLAAAGALIANGPMTQEERWEEEEGYSPSTLASNIAGLICAADIARSKWGDPATAQFLEEYADFLESHLEAWCLTTQGELLPGVSTYYIRLLPTQVKGDQPRNPQLPEDPNAASIFIKNLPSSQQQWFPAKNIVDGGFLELVRYGIRSPNDPNIVNTVKVIDAVLKDNLPAGPCYRRYNHDGYGQGDQGQPFVSTGVGRPWPLLTGERAHYEVAAGRDAKPYIRNIEAFAGTRGLVPEQLWNAADLPTATPPLFNGGPTGSAMPLAWGHAEYIKLVRSVSDGKVFDLLPVVANRYLAPHAPSTLEIWNFDRQLPAMKAGKTLRIPLTTPFSLRWSLDNWNTFKDTPSEATAVGIQYADIATTAGVTGSVAFTFLWTSAPQHWEGVNYTVALTA